MSEHFCEYCRNTDATHVDYHGYFSCDDCDDGEGDVMLVNAEYRGKRDDES